MTEDEMNKILSTRTKKSEQLVQHLLAKGKLNVMVGYIVDESTPISQLSVEDRAAMINLISDHLNKYYPKDMVKVNDITYSSIYLDFFHISNLSLIPDDLDITMKNKNYKFSKSLHHYTTYQNL